MSSPVLVPTGSDAGLVWHHGDPFGEQRLMLSGAGWLGWSNREVIEITGLDRAAWLHSLTTQSFTGNPAPSSPSALVCSPTGHINYVLTGADDGQSWWGWTEPGAGPALVSWLESMRFLMRVQVRLHPELTVRWLGDSIPVEAAYADVASQLGVGREVIVPRDASTPVGQPVGQPVGVWAYEALRVATGVPRIGLDTDSSTIPNELGLFATVLDKGCYTGQETVARVHNLGRPPRRLVRLLLDGSADRLPAPTSPLNWGDRQVGFVGSVAQHHELGPIALGLVKRAIPVDVTLLADGVAASQEVLVDPDVGLHFRWG